MSKMSGIVTIKMNGCTTETLLDYLKSLGVFKIISEQLDKDVTAYWNSGHLNIQTGKVDNNGLTNFLMHDYVPLPLVIPWSGSEFFNVDRSVQRVEQYKKPPSGTDIIESYLATESDRLEEYRRSITTVLDMIENMGITKDSIDTKSTKGEICKVDFLKRLRSNLSEPMVDFMDTAMQIKHDGKHDKIFMNTLLGSGGNDGMLHFGTNFMQSLWICLPEFDDQKKKLSKDYRKFDIKEGLSDALYASGKGCTSIKKDSPGLYYPGGVGGPNGFEGFEAGSIRNPWDLIFAIEGITLLAGSLSRYYGSISPSKGSFPFTCRLSPAGSESLLLSESKNREIWLPLWDEPVGLNSLKAVLREGRADVSRSMAYDGIDFARAVASLGIDRGITQFQRFGIIKGRVGGDNYHTGANLGRVIVPKTPREHIRLLDEIDLWLDSLRRSCKEKNTAAIYGKNLRNIDNAVFDYCKYGGVRRIQTVLRSLGKAEREFASSGQNRPVRPLFHMSPKWLSACNDNSPEYRLACSLASVYDEKVGPIRVHMEPVEWNDKKKYFKRWLDGKKAPVSSGVNISKSLTGLLERRLLEGNRKDTKYPPIDGSIRANLNDVALFLSGSIDESKLRDMFWGLSTIQWYKYDRKEHGPDFTTEYEMDVPNSYALLKLLFIPGQIVHSDDGNWKITRDSDSGVMVKPEPSVLRLINASRFKEAFDTANRRLNVSGLNTKATRAEGFNVPHDQRERLTASLLFPIWELDTISRKVIKEQKKGDDIYV